MKKKVKSVSFEDDVYSLVFEKVSDAIQDVENDIGSIGDEDDDERWYDDVRQDMMDILYDRIQEWLAPKNNKTIMTMKYKDFYGDIKHLHKVIVAEIVALMVEHSVTDVDLLGSSADHAYVFGYPGDGADWMEMEVNKVYYEDGQLMLDVILDIDTDELAEQNENGDIGDAYQCWRANDFEHFIPCAGIEMVYESVWQVLEQKK